MKRFIIILVSVLFIWSLMFFPFTASYFNFWYMMSGCALVLAIFTTLYLCPNWYLSLNISITNILLGIFMAVFLWMVFWIGDKVSSILFSFARPQVNNIYGLKNEISPLLSSLMMFFIIGPSEEIFWRGYIQYTLSQRFGGNKGFIIATMLYALVHVASLNFMLVMAAFTAGLFWGLFYRLFPKRFSAIIISHALWDVAVFIIFPI